MSRNLTIACLAFSGLAFGGIERKHKKGTGAVSNKIPVSSPIPQTGERKKRIEVLRGLSTASNSKNSEVCRRAITSEEWSQIQSLSDLQATEPGVFFIVEQGKNRRLFHLIKNQTTPESIDLPADFTLLRYSASPNGRTVVAQSTSDGTLLLLERTKTSTAGGNEKWAARMWQAPDSITWTSFSWNSDSSLLYASGLEKSTARTSIWQLSSSTGAVKLTDLAGHVEILQVHPKENLLLLLRRDSESNGVLQTYDLVKKRALSLESKFGDAVLDANFSGKGLVLVRQGPRGGRGVLAFARDRDRGSLSQLPPQDLNIKNISLDAKSSRLIWLSDDGGFGVTGTHDLRADGSPDSSRFLRLPSEQIAIETVLVDGEAYALLGSAQDPTSLWRLSTGNPVRIFPAAAPTFSNCFTAPKPTQYTTEEKTSIPGFLYRTSESTQASVVVILHSFFSDESRPIFDPFVQYLTARGHFVFTPNPRGSKGFGANYLREDDQALKVHQISDVLAAVEGLRKDFKLSRSKQFSIFGEGWSALIAVQVAKRHPDWFGSLVLENLPSNPNSFLLKLDPALSVLAAREFGNPPGSWISEFELPGIGARLSTPVLSLGPNADKVSSRSEEKRTPAAWPRFWKRLENARLTAFFLDQPTQAN